MSTPKSPKTRPQKPRASVDALELQRLLMEDARKGDLPAAVRAQVSRAWVDLQEMRLRLAMKPAPKPIDVSAAHKQRRPRATGKVTYSITPQAMVLHDAASAQAHDEAVNIGPDAQAAVAPLPPSTTPKQQ